MPLAARIKDWSRVEIKSTPKQMTLNRVAHLRKMKEKATIEFEDAIVYARDNGCSLRELEPVVGVTNPQVLVIERRARKRLKNENRTERTN